MEEKSSYACYSQYTWQDYLLEYWMGNVEEKWMHFLGC